MNKLWIVLLSVALGSLGQVILKVGANKLGALNLSATTLLSEFIRIIKTPEIVIGLCFFGTSFLIWIKVLTFSDLSYAYPMVSIGYIIVILLSFLLFNEPFSSSKVAGIILIVLGVILLNK